MKERHALMSPQASPWIKGPFVPELALASKPASSSLQSSALQRQQIATQINIAMTC
jgi:hypothetical protein